MSVLDYFHFVAARRVAKTHGILPNFRLLLAIFLTTAVVVSLLHMFADPVFMKWYVAGNADKSGWFALTTDLGKSNWILIATGSVILFMSLYKDDRLSASHMVKWHHVFLKYYFVFSNIVLSGLLAVFLKNLFGRARPFLFDGTSLWESIPFEGVYKYASFPSGHSTTAGALFAALFFLKPKWGIIVAPIAVWVAVSRVAVGAHFPSDVVAGFTLGVVFTWLYARSFARKRLLFEFSSSGRLRLRDLGAKRARRKVRRKRNQNVLPEPTYGPRPAEKA